MGLLLGLPALAGAQEKAGAKQAPAEKKAMGEADQDFERPSIVFEGVKSEIHHDGVRLQEIASDWARLDEEDQTLDMRNMRVKFFDVDQGTTSTSTTKTGAPPTVPVPGTEKVKGTANAGTARTWLKDRPEDHAATHDMFLSDKVIYRTNDGWILMTPEMHYTSGDSMLRSDKGYIKQLPLKSGYIIGDGHGFDIKLSLEKNTFESYKEYGNPAVLKKSDKPVLQP